MSYVKPARSLFLLEDSSALKQQRKEKNRAESKILCRLGPLPPLAHVALPTADDSSNR